MLKLALIAYMTLNGVDLAQTMTCVSSGQCHESNPLMARMVDKPAVFGAVKMGLDSGVIFGIINLHKTHPKLAWLATGIGIGMESVATINNAKQMRGK